MTVYKFNPYSFSKIDSYNQCPRKFWNQYVEKLPRKQQDRTPLLKGGAVHSILEHFPEKSTHKLAPKYHHVIAPFLESELGHHYLMRQSTREFNLGLTVDLEPTTYSDKKALFKGSVDYVCIIDGVLHLIDWKTGKAKDLKWQSFDQLMMYAIYFFIRYPDIDRINISYVYVEHNCENLLELDRKYFDNYVGQFMGYIDNIENDEQFLPKPQRLCEYCDFMDDCSGKGYINIQ